MPEGHSIHRLARQFQDVFVGRAVRARSPQGRFADGAALLDGRVPVRAWAHGKHFFLDFEHGLTLNVHLGMYGAWTFGGDETFAAASSIGAPRRIGETEDRSGPASAEPPAPRPTVRLRLEAEHGWADLVGATTCRVLAPEEVGQVTAKLGPDPLNDDAPDLFVSRAARTRRPIGVVLMDQSMVGGIGNIYRAESLFRAGIDPWRPASQVGQTGLLALYEDNRSLMRRGVRLGRIVTVRPEHRPGVAEEDAWPAHANYVYHRQGTPCRVCGQEAIVVEEMAARNLYRCTVCQR
ncbi:Fpg/Nei family DNA glycosylase [Micrococcus endophyticus]|uniref:Fpg/Nei family DNA glycosylase n=1 Tax=Micrococcus endophyticus TaxID=455343 RepID=UPI0034CD23AC